MTESIADPSKLAAHPDEKAMVPPSNIIPDGVSSPIKHPLDPLNAGKYTYIDGEKKTE